MFGSSSSGAFLSQGMNFSRRAWVSRAKVLIHMEVGSASIRSRSRRETRGLGAQDASSEGQATFTLKLTQRGEKETRLHHVTVVSTNSLEIRRRIFVCIYALRFSRDNRMTVARVSQLTHPGWRHQLKRKDTSHPSN